MDYSDFLGTRLGNKDRRPFAHNKKRRKRLLFNREAEQLKGGIGKGVNDTHRDKAVLGGLFGQNFGNKMRPKPRPRPRPRPRPSGHRPPPRFATKEGYEKWKKKYGWRPDVEKDLGHPDFLSRGDIEKDIAGKPFGAIFGNKMRPKRRRPRRKPLWFGRPKGMKYGSKYRENYSNFIGAEDSFLQKNKWLLLGGAVVLFFGFTKQGKSMLKKMTK
jgi:hypothetical protein